MISQFTIYSNTLGDINLKKALICTLNAHSYNISKIDNVYHDALLNSEVLIPDGISVVLAIRWLTGQRLKKIAGADLFDYEMKKLQKTGGKCFFLGSSEITLQKIKDRVAIEFPGIIVDSYSPPFKASFSDEDNSLMLKLINNFNPDVLMVGMTAPKQEKWAYEHYSNLQVGHICCIGAVFDFYAGTIKRAPQWMINLGLEWFYRFIKEPKRMWRRYLLGNIIFTLHLVKEKLTLTFKRK